MAPEPMPRSKPKEAARRPAADPAAEEPSGADTVPSALDAIPKPATPMTPTQRLSWLREYVNVSTLTSRAASILDDAPVGEGDDGKGDNKPPTPKQRLRWLRQHITAANLTRWISGSISGSISGVNVSAITAPPTGLFRRASASVGGALGGALGGARAWLGGWWRGGGGAGASEHPIGAGARGLLSRLAKSVPQPWVAKWHAVRGRVESGWARAPKGLGWALGVLASLACCGCGCCCLRACAQRYRRRNLHVTYTAVESDPFINDDDDDDDDDDGGLQSNDARL